MCILGNEFRSSVRAAIALMAHISSPGESVCVHSKWRGQQQNEEMVPPTPSLKSQYIPGLPTGARVTER